jgi:hypothetical protein
MRVACHDPPSPAMELARKVRRKIQWTSAVMYLNALTAIAILSITAVALFAQDEPADLVPKPTLADVQQFAEVIGGDQSKLRAYCELPQIHDQILQALDRKDVDAVDALIAKLEALEQRLGPEYDKVIDGLTHIDLNSAEGQEIAEVFKTLQVRCD